MPNILCSRAWPRSCVLAVLATLAPVPAQVQFDELSKRLLPTHVDHTRALGYCDVDGDGDADLVIGNRRQNGLYLNDSNGAFSDATASHMPLDADDTDAVACCDVDGDGDPDLVFGNTGVLGGQNRLYLNDGTGKFTDATASRMPPLSDATLAVGCCDIDADGDNDLVIGNQGRNRLYLNDGSGSFTDATTERLPGPINTTNAVLCCDLDGDGDNDLVFANIGQDRLFLNNGEGVFTDVTAERMPTRNDGTHAVGWSDIDADGDNDLVLANGNFTQQRNRLYLNDGSGTFTDATAARLPLDNDDSFEVALCDMDGDGDTDIVFGNAGVAGQQNRLYLNDGTGTFSDATAAHMPTATDLTWAALCLDVDGDGDNDVVFGNVGTPGQRNRLYLNDGNGILADANTYPLSTRPDWTQAVGCGDVDGDGDTDVIVGNIQRNRLYRNNGNGSFAEEPLPGNDTSAVAVCDVDGDGDLDLFIGKDRPFAQNLLLLNGGTGRFINVTVSHLQTNFRDTRAVTCCDVDGDGDRDLIVANREPNRLYLNDGHGTFRFAADTSFPPSPGDTYAIACCDVDGDGDFDVVFGNGGSLRQNRLYLNDGTGSFIDAVFSMPKDADETRAVACCDVDGDGDPDLIFGNEVGQNRLYLNGGSGTFTDATPGRMPPDSDETQAVACCDVDDDGDMDLVFANGNTAAEQNRLYLNDGTGTFTDATASRMPPLLDQSLAVACCDLDGDGDADQVFGNRSRNLLYFNLLRHLHTPFWLRSGRTFRLDAYARHGPATGTDIAAPFIACAGARIPLPPLGTLRLNPACLIALPTILVPPGGVGSLSAVVPNNPGLVGTIHAQAVLVQNPVRQDLTNATADSVRR